VTDDHAVHVEGPAGPNLLEAVHEAFEELWREAPDVPGSTRVRFEVAVVEVLTNIVQHATPTGPGPVQVSAALRAAKTTLDAEIIDDAADVAIDLDREDPPDHATGGRGLPLVQRAVDELSLTRRGDHNEWHLSLRSRGRNS
jgi:serine/threonine-protein kinase RsbW